MRTKILMLILLTFLMVGFIDGFRRYRYSYRNYRSNYRFSRRYNHYNMNKKKSYNCQPAKPSPQNKCTKVTCERKSGQLNVYLKQQRKEGCLYEGKCYKDRRTIVPAKEGCKVVHCSLLTSTTRSYKTVLYCQYDGKCYPRGKPFRGKNKEMCRCMFHQTERKILPACR